MIESPFESELNRERKKLDALLESVAVCRKKIEALEFLSTTQDPFGKLMTSLRSIDEAGTESSETRSQASFDTGARSSRGDLAVRGDELEMVVVGAVADSTAQAVKLVERKDSRWPFILEVIKRKGWSEREFSFTDLAAALIDAGLSTDDFSVENLRQSMYYLKSKEIFESSQAGRYKLTPGGLAVKYRRPKVEFASESRRTMEDVFR